MIIEEFVYVAAPASRVWQILAAPEHMPTLSPELERIEWIDTPEPDVGGSYRGHNRVGLIRWSTVNVIETVEQERVFAWRTVEFGRLVYRWTYRLRPADSGCCVSERFESTGWISIFYHLWGRYPMLRRGMRRTLQQIKTVSEQDAAQ